MEINIAKQNQSRLTMEILTNEEAEVRWRQAYVRVSTDLIAVTKTCYEQALSNVQNGRIGNLDLRDPFLMSGERYYTIIEECLMFFSKNVRTFSQFMCVTADYEVRGQFYSHYKGEWQHPVSQPRKDVLWRNDGSDNRKSYTILQYNDIFLDDILTGNYSRKYKIEGLHDSFYSHEFRFAIAKDVKKCKEILLHARTGYDPKIVHIYAYAHDHLLLLCSLVRAILIFETLILTLGSNIVISKSLGPNIMWAMHNMGFSGFKKMIASYHDSVTKPHFEINNRIFMNNLRSKR